MKILLRPTNTLGADRDCDASAACDITTTHGQFVVRHLEEDVKARLKRRAERYGRSMEEEARHILRNALKEANQPAPGLGSRIAARFAKTGLTADLPELHGHSARSADFGK